MTLLAKAGSGTPNKLPRCDGKRRFKLLTFKSFKMTTRDLIANDKAAHRGERVRSEIRILCVLFFFSGFPALIYQLVWQRALFRIFGVNVESVTIVVTAFMLGLGLGSLAGGVLSSRRRIALLPLLAVLELATGAFGLVSLPIFNQVGEFTASWSLPAVAGVTLVLVIVPTLLMGATLPVLVGYLVRRSGNVGSSVGLLYYVNTLGAGAACLVSVALLFPFLGTQGAVYVAVALNGAVAMAALAAHWRGHCDSGPAGADAVHAAAVRPPTLAFWRVLALAAAGGFISLSYEIFFFRTVSYASGSSATAFAATLGAFLVGLASGSRRASVNCETLSRKEAMRRTARDLMFANVLGLLYLPILDHLGRLGGGGVIGAAMLMVYLIARFWGSLLPSLAELGIRADGQAGLKTALLYVANIAGSAAGSILTGFVLLDHLGLVAIAVSLCVVGLVCTWLLGAALSPSHRHKLMHAGTVAALGAFAIIAVPHWSANVLENLHPGGHATQFVKVVETRSGIITVDADGAVFGHGMYDGRFNTDLKNDSNRIVRPYALSLFHPAPRDVLLIGLSSGSWAQVIAANPDVVSLTVVEINSGYLKLIADVPEVASVLTNPKVRIVIDDGRRWLRFNRSQKFDAIVSNTTWHFRANATNLLSAEFLDLVRGRLNPGGIFFYNTTDSDRVQRTGCLELAEGARFDNHMVVSQTPIVWDFARWRRTLESYRIDGRALFDPMRAEDRATLDRLMAMEDSLTSNAQHHERPIEPCTDILVRTAGLRPVTDDNMGSEWRYFLGLE
jgi:spermidine synthase